MDKTTSRNLLPLVNNEECYHSLRAYVESRIETMRTYLETTKDAQKITEIQGAIAELRRMHTLREQAIEGAK